MNKRLALLAPVLFSVAIFASCSSGNKNENSGRVETISEGQAKRTHQFEAFETESTLSASRDSVIKATVAGAVGDTFIGSPGSVSDGDALMDLDLRELELEISSKQSALKLAQAELDQLNAGGTLEQAPPEIPPPPPPTDENAGAPPAVDAHAADKMGNQTALLQSRIESLQNDIAALQFKLDKGKITAPFAGVLTPLESFYTGQPIKEGEELYRLVATSPLRLRALVPLESGHYLKEGMRLSFIPYANPDQTATGTVESLSPYAQNNSLFELTGLIDNPMGSLKDGQKGAVHIKTSKEVDVLTVPRAAIVYPESHPDLQPSKDAIHGPFVFVIRDDRASAQPVKLGPVYDDSIAIKDGLDEGDQVATSDLDFLFDGAKVKVRALSPTTGIPIPPIPTPAPVSPPPSEPSPIPTPSAPTVTPTQPVPPAIPDTTPPAVPPLSPPQSQAMPTPATPA